MTTSTVRVCAKSDSIHHQGRRVLSDAVDVAAQIAHGDVEVGGFESVSIATAGGR
jgi:hypothetical protein